LTLPPDYHGSITWLGQVICIAKFQEADKSNSDGSCNILEEQKI
jgi:hypothetical protein